MTTKRIDSERVRAYTQALMDAASAGGRSERDLQQLRHAIKFSPEMLGTLADMIDAKEDYLIDKVYAEFRDRLEKGDFAISVDVTTAVPMDMYTELNRLEMVNVILSADTTTRPHRE